MSTRIPYEADKFIEILDLNANLHDEYVAGQAVLRESAEDLLKSSEQMQVSAERVYSIKDSLDATARQITQLAEPISAIADGNFIFPKVVNDDLITPTGTYADSTYYNVEFGVRIAYDKRGDIFIIMKGGTTTAYEYLNFIADSVPGGVTVETTVPASSSYVTAMPGLLQVGIIHGVSGKVELSLVMDAYNATYDYTSVKITVTPV